MKHFQRQCNKLPEPVAKPEFGKVLYNGRPKIRSETKTKSIILSQIYAYWNYVHTIPVKEITGNLTTIFTLIAEREKVFSSKENTKSKLISC